MLEVHDLVVRYGEVTAVDGVSFEVEEGAFVSLLGPSGCGKTTTLRAVAGLEDPASGRIAIGGEAVVDDSVRVPPNRREINMVFQSYAVWPHLSVVDNVSYGLRSRKRQKSEIRERTRRALELVGLQDFGERYGTELSGGQQQRVALARAIVTEPRLLLFDEPLSNLDAGLRARMRSELVELHRSIGKTAVYVTHDQDEAMVMSDRIILMNRGRIEQVGSPRELYERPRSLFAATFLGESNIARATVRAVERRGDVVLDLHDGRTASGRTDAPPKVGAAVLTSIRPERVRLEAMPGPAGAWHGRVERLHYLGSRLELVVHVGDVRLRVDAHPSSLHREGDEIALTVAAEHVVVLPDELRT